MDFVGDILSAPFICLGWIIVGAIAGSLARSIMRAGDRPFINDLLLGIAGAFIGGLVAGILGLGPDEESSGIGLVLANLIIATFGAALIIGGWRALSRSV